MKLVKEVGRNRRSEMKALYKCDCGKVFETLISSVKNGNTKSCGCGRGKAIASHGMSGTSLYNIWCGFISRCENKNNPSYNNYGGRGIDVCDSWKKSFINFYWDMGERPSKEYSLDRIDNNKGYSPENCRWATRYEQNTNTRRNLKPITIGNKTLSIREWSNKSKTKYLVIWKRLKRGWSNEEAVYGREKCL